MSEERNIPGFARRFVARKLEQFTKEASKGSGLYYELFAQNFTGSVDRLAAMSRRGDLREYIRSEARKTGNYHPEECARGRWDYDVEAGELRWQSKPVSAARRHASNAAEKYGSKSRCERGPEITEQRLRH